MNTKALEQFVKDHHPLCRRNKKGCWNATCDCGRDQASAELAELEGTIRIVSKALDTSVQRSAQLSTSAIEAIQASYQLTQKLAHAQIERDAARKFIEAEAFVTLKARMWLEANPK